LGYLDQKVSSYMSQSPEEFQVEAEDSYPFTTVPHWVALSNISDTAFRLYNALLMHMNRSSRDANVWPSKDSLAALVGMKRADYIDKHLNQLYAIGAVTVKQNFDPQGMKKRNTYTLRLNPPRAYKDATILSDWYAARHEEEAEKPVPGEDRVRTRRTPCSVPGEDRVKQEQLPKQEQLKEEIPHTSVSLSSEIASRSTDLVPRRDDVESLCTLLADRIEANGSKRPNITDKWRDAARLMIDRDGRDVVRIQAAILWCQNHEFWKANVLSMPKLREKYDQLRLVAQRERAEKGSQGSANGRNGDLGTDAHYARYLERAASREADDLPTNLWDRMLAMGGTS